MGGASFIYGKGLVSAAFVTHFATEGILNSDQACVSKFPEDLTIHLQVDLD